MQTSTISRAVGLVHGLHRHTAWDRPVHLDVAGVMFLERPPSNVRPRAHRAVQRAVGADQIAPAPMTRVRRNTVTESADWVKTGDLDPRSDVDRGLTAQRPAVIRSVSYWGVGRNGTPAGSGIHLADLDPVDVRIDRASGSRRRASAENAICSKIPANVVCTPTAFAYRGGSVSGSTTRTATPRRASSMAAVSPTGPAPATSTSTSSPLVHRRLCGWQRPPRTVVVWARTPKMRAAELETRREHREEPARSTEESQRGGRVRRQGRRTRRRASCARPPAARPRRAGGLGRHPQVPGARPRGGRPN